MTDTPRAARPSGWRLAPALRDVLVVVVVAALFLTVVALPLDLSRIHLGLPSFNDQAGYISVARTLVDSHVLRSNIIYPSTLLQDASRNYFYMPGQYFALAAAYWLFGFGTWQSLLPSVLAYVIAAAAVFVVARRFFDRQVAMLAVVLFMLFPPNLVYSLSAMSEMTRTAATLAAFALFVHLPDRWKLLLGPWLVAVPFIFRETGALLVVPMAMLLGKGKGWRAQGPTAVFIIYALAVLGLVYMSDLSAGRPTLLPALVFDNRFATVHTDALAQQLASPPSYADWLWGLPVHAWQNGRSLVKALRSEPFSFPMWSMLNVLVAGLAVAGALKWRNYFFGMVLALALAHYLFILTLYDSFGYGWLRMLQTPTAFLTIVAAASLLRIWRRLVGRRGITWKLISSAMLLLAVLGSLRSVQHFFQPAASLSRIDEDHTAWLEEVGHDDRRLLVAPLEFLDYAYHHYPVMWSFIPANGPTLSLLAARYPIGTLIGPKSVLDANFRPDELAAVGLVLEKAVSLDGVEYLVYRGVEAAPSPD